MKFLITLIIFFNGEISPKVYTYQFMDFTDYKTCEIFINTKQDFLKQSIEGQFPETINSTAMLCLTQEQITEFANDLELKKWQQQKRI
jgi:hypothetical protein